MSTNKTSARGFSLVELMIVLAVLALLVSFAVVSTARTRDRVRLADATRTFGNYLEKARTDSIRRHADSGSQAGVQVVNSTTFRVSYDSNSDGVLAATETLDVTLPNGVTFVTNPAPTAASYTWQGRVAAPITYTLQNSTGTATLSITTAGDVTINSSAAIPATTATPYPTPGATATPTPTPTPTTGNANGCSIQPDTQAITVRKSGKTTATINEGGSVFGQSGVATITFSTSNLKLTYSAGGGTIKNGDTFTVYPSAPTAITVADIKNSTGNYTTTITLDSDCGSYDVIVTVTP
jgi:prepilin-type N-terminal cleavage/methylation domain-containing protein